MEETWPLFPMGGLNKAKAYSLCDTHTNYGLHQLSPGFDLLDKDEDDDCVEMKECLVGTRSLGYGMKMNTQFGCTSGRCAPARKNTFTFHRTFMLAFTLSSSP